jgi:hypothetical protein
MDRSLCELCDSFASFAVKDFDRKGRKVYREGRKEGPNIDGSRTQPYVL